MAPMHYGPQASPACQVPGLTQSPPRGGLEDVNTMAERFDVVVVGFGPAGASCAGLLGSMGVRTLVIDRARSVYDKPRAFALDHEIMRVFQNLGIVDKVLPHTAPFTPSEYYGVDGRLIKRLGAVPPPYPLGWPPNVVFTQPPVEEIMRSAAAAHDSVRLSLGTELIGLEQDASGVRLRLRSDDGGADGGPAGAVAKAFDVSARYVIGCDGAASTVRGLLDMPLEDLGFDEPWLVVDVQVNESGLGKLPDVSIQYCEPARPCTYLSGPGNHRRWEIMLLPGEDPAVISKPENVWPLVSRWITPADADLERAAVYTFHSVIAEGWRRGRLLLAGDSAHQTPPFLGQGMCAGIRDVANLAWKLVLVTRGLARDSLLDTYESERKPHVHAFIDLAVRLGDIIQTTDAAVAAERDRKFRQSEPEIFVYPAPMLGAGVHSGVAPAGGVFGQPALADGRLLDAAIGLNFAVIGERALLDSVDAGTRARWRELGASVLPDPGGELAEWLRASQARALILRPDRYVLGIAGDAVSLERLSALLPAAA